MKNLVRLELKNLLGAKLTVVALMMVVAAGVYGVINGRSVIAKQIATIDRAPAIQAEHTAKQLELNSADFGNLLYYHQFATAHKPSGWAAFSVGQRDVNPFNLKVRMLTLEGQLYDSENANPTAQMYGNFDAAFVIVFLLPLLAIALCHNVISSDDESGIWNLLRSQPFSAARIVAVRYLLRFAVLASAALAIVCGGAISAGSLDARFGYMALAAIAYVAFWVAVSAFVATFRGSSAINAVTLLGFWIVTTILAPALLSLVISTAIPIPESFEVAVAQREGYHQKWDRPKADTMKIFYEFYPEYRDIPIPEDKFSWGWYYAMQHAGDAESAAATGRYMDKLRLRDDRTKMAAIALPSVMTQLTFNSIGRTDLSSHLDYLETVRRFHEKVRTTFYPAVFGGSKTDADLIRSIGIGELDDESRSVGFQKGIAVVIAWAMIFAAGTYFRMRRIDSAD